MSEELAKKIEAIKATPEKWATTLEMITYECGHKDAITAAARLAREHSPTLNADRLEKAIATADNKKDSPVYEAINVSDYNVAARLILAAYVEQKEVSQ
jgi:hypothetical protein